MHCPRIVSDKLIFFPSSNVLPTAPVCFTFSLPARSTRLSFAETFAPSAFRCSIVSVITTCDRDDSEFIFVEAIDRDREPS